MAKSLCEELLDILGNIGVTQIFGVTGDALNPLVDAIRRDDRIEWFTVRHEEAGAFAAAHQAKLTGKLGVCCGTVGPGALHLLNGLYDAKRDHAPVLAITGQVPESEYGTGYFQEVDLESVFADVCVFNQTVRTADQFQRLVQQAVQAAIDEQGVAHISVPVDIIGLALPDTRHRREIVAASHPRAADETAIERAAVRLNQSRKTTLLIGDGARGAEAAILQMASQLQAPIVNTLKGADVIAFDNPYRLGGIGHLGTPQGLGALDDCEVLVIIGADFPYRAFLPQGIDIIQIDTRSTHIGRRCAVNYPLVGHTEPTLSSLVEYLVKNPDGSFLSGLQKKRTSWIGKLDKWSAMDRSRDVLHPQTLIRNICDKAADDAVFVADVGTVTVWAARHLRLRQGQRLFGSFTHGSLGVGLPGAIGIQALNRKRQVLALCGDGGFGMLMADFVTAVKYELPLVAVVLNNSKFSFVELEMQASGYARYATDIHNPNFAEFADSCGGLGIRISRADEILPAIDQALASRKPCIIDALVNPNELILPPKIEASAAIGYAVGKLKELWLEATD